MNKSLQAKDLEDSVVLEFIQLKSWEKARDWKLNYPAPVMVFDFPDPLPLKVLLAKARSLIKRGLIEGCACGCRGDFMLTPLGEKYLLETLSGATN